jgi:hypothetical protein
MQWKKATEFLPNPGEEVLIRDKSQYHLAHYDPSQKVFILRNGDQTPITNSLLWTPLLAP